MIIFLIPYFLDLMILLLREGVFFTLNDQNNFSIKNIFLISIGTERVRWIFVSKSFKKKYCMFRKEGGKNNKHNPQ